MGKDRPGATGGHFGAVPPQARIVFSLARVVPRKKVKGPVPLECILGLVPWPVPSKRE